ncbi:MAG: helix-turn-helix domain-containing protein [Oscillospiraceae bacterium]
MRGFQENRSYTSDTKVWVATYEDIDFAAHWHKEIEILFVSKGRYKVSLNNKKFIAKTGDVIVCGSGDVHRCSHDESGSIMCVLVFETDVIGKVYNKNRCVKNYISAADLEKYGLNLNLQNGFSVIKEELATKGDYGKFVIEAELSKMWAYLSRNFKDDNNIKNIYNGVLDKLQNLLTYIDENYAEDITLEVAANLLNYSVFHFSKLFANLMGISFIKYLNIIRVEKAIELIMNTDKNFTDIGNLCGFNCTRSFNRQFKEVTGTTPSEFKKEEYKNSQEKFNKKIKFSSTPYVPSTVVYYKNIF